MLFNIPGKLMSKNEPGVDEGGSPKTILSKSQFRGIHKWTNLYETYNNQTQSIDCVSININHIHTSRQTKFPIDKMNNFKVGMNVLSNRLC